MAGLNLTPGCTKHSTGQPLDQSRLLPCPPGAWAEDLCCPHPPAQTGQMAVIWVCALIPSDCHNLFKLFWISWGWRPKKNSCTLSWRMRRVWAETICFVALEAESSSTAGSGRGKNTALLHAVETWRSKSFTTNTLHRHTGILKSWESSSSPVSCFIYLHRFLLQLAEHQIPAQIHKFCAVSQAQSSCSTCSAKPQESCLESAAKAPVQWAAGRKERGPRAEHHIKQQSQIYCQWNTALVRETKHSTCLVREAWSHRAPPTVLKRFP